MENYVKQIFETSIKISKTKKVGFELYKISLVDRTNFRGYFYYYNSTKMFGLHCRSFHIFGRKTEDGKRRAKQEKKDRKGDL